MAEKISTLVIKVDLDCHLCYKKIRKTLCKLQDRENIRTISYDEKNNIVTVSGPFDPKKLTKKLYCKACKVIKDIQIVEPKEKEKPKEVKPEPAKEKEKPKESKPAEPAKPAKEKPKEVKPAEPAKPAKEKEKEKPKTSAETPKEKEKEKPKVTFELPKPVQEHPVGIVTQMPGPACPQSWAVGPVCQCGPWYEAHYGGQRCYACGRAYGWVSEGPPCGSYRTCHFFSDEDPASTCNVM